MNKQDFKKLTDSRIVCLDGATGTNLTLRGMPKGVSTEAWVLDHPDVLVQLQEEFVDAGADILYAPTFGANRKVLSGFGLSDKLEEMNKRLLGLSLDVAKGRVLVAGDMSPTGLVPDSAGGDASYERIFEIYSEQAEILYHAGADLMAVETMMSADETAIALDAISSVCDLPVLCSFSVYADGKCFFDGNIFDAAAILQEMGAAAVGMNCSNGPDQMESLVQNLVKNSSIPIIAKPNAGLPQIDEKGNAIYSLGPEAFVNHMKVLVDAGARLVGGCCGTEPEHIRLLKRMIEEQS
ncbi:MAG: homocysteine S-methyltransferase family protein [Eubacterium sp.]|nr:homocysteine S-methyltransferase family protein [Eubacterium sp.]